MIYIKMKYETKVSDGVTAQLEDYVSSINATAIEAEAQPSRFVWNTADGLGLAIEYGRIKHLCINRIEVDPINASTVSAALMLGCPHPKPLPPPPPCPPPGLHKVVILPDSVNPPRYTGYFAPGCDCKCHAGDCCRFIIKMHDAKLLKVFANERELLPDPGSTPDISQFTFKVLEDTFITVHYVTIQKG